MALGQEWQALEAQAHGGFFQGWGWMGCLAEERFADPWLIRAVAQGPTVGLALFNRRQGVLSLAESGDPTLDAPWIEHNAPLTAADAPPGTETALLQAAWRVPGVRRLRLSGVPSPLVSAGGGRVLRRQDQAAPLVDLAQVRARRGDYLAGLSANSRQQIRRALRTHAAIGPLALDRAETPVQAAEWLAALTILHTAAWQARGKPGAFATPFLGRFHAALVGRALAAGTLDLLRCSAGPVVLGYLYNFRQGGRVLAYQSGFAIDPAQPQLKPGLCCHVLAIERALAAGDTAYDFLAGPARYKLSLANASATMSWAECVPRWSLLGLAAAARAIVRLRP